MRRYLTALRPVYVPFREAEPDQLHDAWYLATAAKRHPDGQRDDGLTRDGRVTARRERIFLMIFGGGYFFKLHLRIILRFYFYFIVDAFQKWNVHIPSFLFRGRA